MRDHLKAEDRKRITASGRVSATAYSAATSTSSSNPSSSRLVPSASALAARAPSAAGSAPHFASLARSSPYHHYASIPLSSEPREAERSSLQHATPFISGFATREASSSPKSSEIIELKDIAPLLSCHRSFSETSLNIKIRNMKLWSRTWRRFKALFEKKEPTSRTIAISGMPLTPYPYPPNTIRNQKYNIMTFLPLVFFEQFRFFFNAYFLLVCISQFFEDFRVGYLFTYFSPLLFVMFITMSKEAYDDIKRYQRDKEANSQLYQKLTPDGLAYVPSSHIRVGDIVYMEKNQRIPADLVLLRTTEKSGSIFVRTDQLDGETDWKLRVAVPSTQKLESEQALFDHGISIYAERPHKDIHTFLGTISIESKQAIEPLSVENTLWMNTVLASGSAFALVLYTGRHTRAVMNTSRSSTKFGLIDLELNRAAKVLFAISLLVSLVLVCLKGFFGPWHVYLVRFFILFSYIIPLSLRVNVDMARLLYSYQIIKDREIPNVIVRNSSIPEEMGRIGFLLSDKTGTLTQNDMELKKLHLGTMSFGSDATDEVISHLSMASKQQKQEPVIEVSHFLKRGRRDISSRISDIVQALAVCHNVTPSVEGNAISYQASSPDEVAIVKWTQLVGVTLIYRDRETIRLRRDTTQELYEFSIIDMFPFTSESKRMGIVVQDKTSGEIFFYLKGADTVMAAIVQKNDWLEEECDNMAREGLRTLVIARKRLSEELMAEFQEKYAQAKLSMSDRNASMRAVVKSLLEADLELLGITGVEDRLQDDVKLTLETLRNAGIRVWMLTGDKVETATCIAISSKLVSRNQNIYQVQKLGSRNEAINALSSLQSRLDSALVIDGQSLQLMLDHYKAQFLEIASALPSVICCRCTPTQKADVAKLLKTSTKKRICCIGDGGNDVSMIQAAHVGIGIVGKEGRQASLAADFSMTQFSHLTRLLVWHGRNSYKRTSKLSQFVIHRGFVIAMMQAVFSAIFYFSPIPLYQGFIAVGYCTVYTTLPVFSLALDKDVKEGIAMMYPELYKELTKGRSLCFRTFFTWILVSVYQGGMIMLMSIWLFESDFIHIVSITFTSLILNELLMVALQINTWHFLMILAQLASILLYILSVRLLRSDFDPVFTSSLPFFWKVAVITVVSFLPLFVIKIVRRIIHPPNYTKLS